MLSFNNDSSLKAAILAGIEAHEAADEIIHGTYWEDGKGCAVGCTLHAYAKATGRKCSYSNHAVYDEIFGAGGMLIGKLEGRIFEGMWSSRAKMWPARLMRSVPVGRDLSMVWPRFAFWLLTDELAPIVAKHHKSRAALADVAALYREWCDGTKPSFKRWTDARAAAYAAANAYAADAAAVAADDAAAYAADAAYTAYAADAAAADAAAAAYAYDGAHAYSDTDAARQASYCRMADKLIEILEGA